MTDQADHLRQLVRDSIEAQPSLSPGIPLVAVSGSLPSIGATTLVFETAQALTALGKRVLMVDANLECPTLGNLKSPSGRYALEDVLNGGTSVKEALQSVGDKLQLLPGKPIGSTPPELNRASLDRLLAELNNLQALAEIILVDVGQGMTPWVQNWWQAAQQIVLITTCDEQSITTAYTMVKLASQPTADSQLKLVLNQYDNESSAARIAERFADTCGRFLGVNVAESQAVPHSAAGQREYQRALRLLASDILSESLISYRRLPNGDASQRLMPALPENLEQSLKHLQHTA